MPEHTGMSTCAYSIFSKPSHTFAYVFNILACARYHQVSFFDLQKMRCQFLINISQGLVCICPKSCVYLSIVNAANTCFSKVLLLKSIPSGESSYFT